MRHDVKALAETGVRGNVVLPDVKIAERGNKDVTDRVRGYTVGKAAAHGGYFTRLARGGKPLLDSLPARPGARRGPITPAPAMGRPFMMSFQTSFCGTVRIP